MGDVQKDIDNTSFNEIDNYMRKQKDWVDRTKKKKEKENKKEDPKENKTEDNKTIDIDLAKNAEDNGFNDNLNNQIEFNNNDIK